MSDLRRKRIKRLVLFFAAVLSAGALYAFITDAIGFGIPCVFNLITGLKCPGCGISRMCKSLMVLDFRSAWEYNAAIMCLIVPGAAVCADISVRYIKDGTRAPHKWANAVMCIMICVLLLFGIVRNLPYFRM